MGSSGKNLHLAVGETSEMRLPKISSILLKKLRNFGFEKLIFFSQNSASWLKMISVVISKACLFQSEVIMLKSEWVKIYEFIEIHDFVVNFST